MTTHASMVGVEALEERRIARLEAADTEQVESYGKKCQEQ